MKAQSANIEILVARSNPPISITAAVPIKASKNATHRTVTPLASPTTKKRKNQHTETIQCLQFPNLNGSPPLMKHFDGIGKSMKIVDGDQMDVDASPNSSNAPLSQDKSEIGSDAGISNDDASNAGASSDRSDKTSPNNTIRPNGMSWASALLSNGPAPTTSAPKTGASRPTPIQIGTLGNDDSAKLPAALGAAFPNANFRWHQLKARSQPRIFTDDHDTKGIIMKWLLENGIEFNSYAEKGHRRHAFLLRGLRYGNDADNINDIAAALKQHGIGESVEITRFRSGYMKRNSSTDSTPIFRIVAGHGAKLETFAAIKQIGQFSVRFELMKQSTVIHTQKK